MLLPPMRHRTARICRLPPRATASHHGGCFLLGQRLQTLLEPDRPAPEDLLRIGQIGPHPLRFGSASSSSTRTTAAFRRASGTARIDGIRHPLGNSISNGSRLPRQAQSHV